METSKLETEPGKPGATESDHCQRLAHGLGEKEISKQEKLAPNKSVNSKTGTTNARSAKMFHSTVFTGHLPSVQILDYGENQCELNLVPTL